jgi:HAMP domain-containing protein
VVVPEACGPEAAQALADAFPGNQAAPRLLAASHLDDVLPLLGLPRLKRRFPGGRLALGRVRRKSRVLASSAAVIGGIFLLALAWPQNRPVGPAPTLKSNVPAEAAVDANVHPVAVVEEIIQPLAASPAGAPPSLSLIETRAPFGEGCAAVAFQRAKPVISRHRFASDVSAEAPNRAVAASNLCDLRHRIVNTGLGRLEIAVIAARFEQSGARFRTRPLAAARTLDPGETLDLDARPPRAVPSALVQRLAVLALPSSWPHAADRLKQAAGSLNGAGSADAWARTLAVLARQPLFVTTGGEIFTPQTVAAEKIGQTRP